MGFHGEKILITGAGGFLGMHLTRRVAETAEHVYCVTRKSKPLIGLMRSNITCYDLDLRSPGVTGAFFDAMRPDVVFHLATASGGSNGAENVIPHLEGDIATTVSCLLAAHRFGVRRIVVPGSTEEPVVQLDKDVVPDSPYSMAKMVCVAYGRMFHALYQTPVVICRIAMTYGPGQKPRKIVPYLIRSMLANKAPKIASAARLVDWIFVDDTIEALMLSATTAHIEGATIEIGSGKLLRIGDLARKLREMIPGAPDCEESHQPSFGGARAANISFASRALQWTPKISLEDGLRVTIDWYRAHEFADPELGGLCAGRGFGPEPNHVGGGRPLV